MSRPPADSAALGQRYARIAEQLTDLYRATTDPLARMATAAALLHHKMPHFFWTGFYRLSSDELIVGPYQGPLACQVLPHHTGVCWAGILQGRTILVEDVHDFPGHVSCDARSQSEVVVPVRDAAGMIVGVLDVDAEKRAAFRDVDVQGLERIAALIYAA